MKTLPQRRTNALPPMALIAVILLGLGAAGCGPTKKERIETRTIRRTVRLRGAKAVRAELEFGIGNVEVNGGAKGLMEAKFVVRGAAPIVRYASRGKRGRLSIQQPYSAKAFFSSGSKQKFHVKLNNKPPLALHVDLGVGNSLLNLAKLNIAQVDIDSGVGRAIVDLRGRWDHDVDVDIDSGVGELTLRVPKDFALRIDLDQGIGDFAAENLKRRGRYYVSAAYPKGTHRMNIKISQGAGNVDVE